MAEMRVSVSPRNNSTMATGTVAAPGVGAALVTALPAAGPGLYEIHMTAWLSAGAPAAADNKNLEFRFGATPLLSLPVIPALNVPTTTRVFFSSDGTTNFSVNATGAGTAGVTYNVTFVATKQE